MLSLMTEVPDVWTNWSGLASGRPLKVLTPGSTAEVSEAVIAAAHQGITVKMPGTGHSFTDIALTDGLQLRPDRLRGIVAVDREAMTATALAGTPLHELNAALEQLGLSLHNMGDVDRQTVAGATSTGTHGTGGVVASLSAQIAGLELVTADGRVITANDKVNPDIFAVARIGLGALGILTSVTFKVEPLFTMQADERPILWNEVLSQLDDLDAAHHHVEFYWFPHTDRCLLKCNDRTLDDPEPLRPFKHWLDDEFLSNRVFGWVNRAANARPSLVPRLNEISGRALSARRYSDVAHKVFISSRTVKFREMEYAVPREVGLDALRDVRRLVDSSGWKISFPIEVRLAPQDDIPLSTASGRDVMYLAFHVNQQTDHAAYFAGVEKILRDYDGRPHWGKLHTRTAADLEPAYPGWGEFAAIRDRLDPGRVFTNGYLERVLGS